MPTTTKVIYYVYDDLEALSHQAAAHAVTAISSAIAARGAARIAVSGGNTPKRTFELLADPAQPYFDKIDWAKLYFFFVDERCVPPGDKDSNFRMTREALLSKVPLPEENIFRMEGELDPAEAAAIYESSIRAHFRLEGAEAPRFDWITLGMGPDGHTASLFPHTEAVNEVGRIVTANNVPQKNMWRITLTWPVINQGRSVLFLIDGADKAQVLHDVLLGPLQPDTTPAQLIRPASGELTLLLTSVAASALPPPGPGQPGSLEITR